MKIEEELKNIISHQIKIGNLHHGQTAYIKFAGDGTSITKKETATAHSVTLSNGVKALQIGTVSLVMQNESFQVHIAFYYHRWCQQLTQGRIS